MRYRPTPKSPGEVINPGPRRQPPKTALARALHKRLDELNWTNTDLAKKVGRSKQEVGRWVSGTVKPGIDMLARIAKVLGVKMESLVSVPESPNR